MSLNEQLAVEVMRWEKKNSPVTQEPMYVSPNKLVSTVAQIIPIADKDWNPTADLNQLRMCYEAAEKDWHTRTATFEYEFTGCLQRLFIEKQMKHALTSLTVAWVKHPELVAQAILKAKEVN